MRARYVGALLLTLGLALSAAEVRGQAGPRVAPGVSFETYRFSEANAAGLESVSLTTAPFVGRAGVGGFRLTVAGAWASGSVTTSDGSESSLSGLVDTEVRVDADLVRDQLTLTVRGFLPTGTATHDIQESLVAGVVAADLLPFRISNWGSGGGVFLEATASRRFDGFGAGVSAGWGRPGSFEPLTEQTTVYRPGQQFSARLALDAEVGAATKLAVLIGYRRFGDDQLDDRNLFRSGARLEAIVSAGFPTVNQGAAAVYAGVLRRETGTALAEVLPSSAAQDLILAGADWRLRWGENWVQPGVDLRIFRSEDGIGQGFNLGVGASAEYGAGSWVTVIPSLTGRFGRVDVREGQQSGFTGLELALAVRMGR